MQPSDTIGGDGLIDANAVSRSVRGQVPKLRDCYNRELIAQPSLRGLLDVTFTIGPRGAVTRVSSTGLATAPAVGACVAEVLRGVAFPAPEGGSVDFNFPFLFCPVRRTPDAAVEVPPVVDRTM